MYTYRREKMNKAKKLRELIKTNDIVMCPGAYDAWSARLVEQVGFQCVYMTGYGVSASVLGRPDIGLITMSEMATMAKNMNLATNIPVIADADTGYGGTLNVARTINEYEIAGIAAIQLEDQIFPKRCGHMENKQLISKDEMIAKVRAAVYARNDSDTLIIARTDARAVNGLDDAIDRATAYADAGADVLFVEASQSKEEMYKIGKILKGVPLLANMAEGGKTPPMTKLELMELGYKIVIYPSLAIYTVTKALRENYELLMKDGTNENGIKRAASWDEFHKAIGLAEMRELEASFLNK